MNVTATTNAAQAMPSLDQATSMFLRVAVEKLQYLERIREKDEEWIDKDVDVDMAIILVLERILAMSEKKAPSANDFASEWYRISSVVNLSRASFSRPASWYGLALQDVANFFRQVPEILELAKVGT